MGTGQNFLRNLAVRIFIFEHLAPFELFPHLQVLQASAIAAAASMPQVSSLRKMGRGRILPAIRQTTPAPTVHCIILVGSLGISIDLVLFLSHMTYKQSR